MAQLSYGDQEAAHMQVADDAKAKLDPPHHDELEFGLNGRLQGEGYSVLPPDEHQKNTRRSSEALPVVEHKRVNPISGADQVPSLDVSNGHGVLDDQASTKPKDDAGYTSFGIDESPDENSGTEVFDEGSRVKETAPHETMEKEAEDHLAASGGGIGVKDLNGEFVDLTKDNTHQGNVGDGPKDAPTEEQVGKQGLIDVHDIKGNFVDLSEGNSEVEDDKSSSGDVGGSQAEWKGQAYEGVEGGPQEQMIGGGGLHEKQKPCDDYNRHKNKHFEGEDGRDKINVESFNIYSGEPQNKVYDTKQFSGNPQEEQWQENCRADDADVSDLQESVLGSDESCDKAKLEDGKGDKESGDENVMPRDFGINEYESRIEDRKEKDVEGFGEKISNRGDETPGVIRDDVGVYPGQSGVGGGVKDVGKLDKGLDDGEAELLEEPVPVVPKEIGDGNRVQLVEEDDDKAEEREERKEPFTEDINRPVVQDAGVKAGESEDRGHERELDTENELNRIADQRADNAAPHDGESPYTGFDRTEDYVEEGYGGEGFVPKHNVDIDRELQEPTEKVEEEKGRRRAEDNPLDVSEGLPNEMKTQEASEGEVKKTFTQYGAEGGEGAEKVIRDYADVSSQQDAYERPPSLLHPQLQDLVPAFENRGNDETVNQEEQQHQHEEGGHKKGLFEKIKEKLTY